MQQAIALRFSSDLEDFTGTLRTFTSPPDQVAFERTFQVGIGRFGEEPRAEWILWFIWRAWARETRHQLEFEAFIEQLEDYDLPTAPEASERPPEPEPVPA
jgi:hypothetical protein